MRSSLLSIPLIVSGLLLSSAGALAEECTFAAWRTYKGTKLYRNEQADAYLFQTDHMRIDADGAPNAYGPDDSGLDLNANAGFPGTSWWRSVLVADPANNDRPYVQPTGEFAGFYVSQTALNSPDFAKTDPKRYVDATTYPYLVFPRTFAPLSGTGRLGDFGFAINLKTGRKSGFIVADIGPSNAKLGEVSMALAKALGGRNVNPRTGAGQPDGDNLYVVFRYSSSSARSGRWRLTKRELQAKAREELDAIGGVPALMKCVAG